MIKTPVLSDSGGLKAKVYSPRGLNVEFVQPFFLATAEIRRAEGCQGCFCPNSCIFLPLEFLYLVHFYVIRREKNKVFEYM